MDEKVYDSVGVIICPDRDGKWKVSRIGTIAGKVEVIHELTRNRSMNAAHRVGCTNFELLLTDLSRGKLHVSTPTQTSLKFDQ